tara:strand:- start:515 stop:907 length:393 start_codon:yes stop_codon:yes gene_type:complete
MDYYAVLGVDVNASAADLKTAYKKLAVQYHPDKNLGCSQDAETRFKAIRQAYEVLSHSVSRCQHDAAAQQNKRRQGPTLHAPCEFMYDGACLDQTGVTIHDMSIHRLAELDAAFNDCVDWCTRPEVARSA